MVRFAQEWLQHELSGRHVHKVLADRRWRLILFMLNVKHMNSTFRRLYHGGYWLSGPEAQSIGEEGVLSLQAYRQGPG